jgi:YggT family protein
MIDAFLLSLATLFISIITLYKWVVIISTALTWFSPDPSNPIVQMLYRLTQPVYNKMRRYIPTLFNGIDLAPLILIFALLFLETFLISLYHLK